MFQVMQLGRDTQGSEKNLRTVLSIHFNILKKYGPMAYFNHTSFLVIISFYLVLWAMILLSRLVFQSLKITNMKP